MTGASAFGVYVHVPFCTRRCDYCAFATWSDRSHLMADYVAAVRSEIAVAVAGGMPPADSVFFGGGTPSLLPADELLAVLAEIPCRPAAEVTVECNPEQATPERFSAYRDGGVTRLSIGVQSMVPHVLDVLGRQHHPDQAVAAADAAGQAGFAAAYSVDLIFGAVGESPEDWNRTLAAVLALDPPPAHVSAYSLIPEPSTPLGRDPGRHPDPDDQAEKYAVADETLAGAGLAWYEISNWAVPGAESRHNQLYWRQGPYRGFGCAAHSHAVGLDGTARRWWNVRTPERYVGLIRAARSPVAAEETLQPELRNVEYIELALRTRDGVPASRLPAEADLGPLVDADLVVPRNGRVILTRRGRLLATEVSLRLVG